MKKLIISILDKIQVQYNLDMPTFINIDVLDLDTYCEVAGTTITEAFDVWGLFDYCLMYSDNPDYGFILDSDTEKQVEEKIVNWLKEIHVINEPTK